MEGNKPNGLDALPPKVAFVVGILAVLAIGFFVLLGMMINDGSIDMGKKDDGAAVVANDGTDNNSGDLAPAPAVAPAVTDRDHVRGKADAAVTIVEYSDFECPYCAAFHETMKQAVDQYEVRWVYRHFPLQSLHPDAQKKAEAAECVYELGGDDAFWAFADVLFAQGPAVSELASLAASSAGVNEGEFQSCLDAGRYTDYVNDQADAGYAAGISGTPGSFIVGSDGQTQLVPGALPLESIGQVVESML